MINNINVIRKMSLTALRVKNKLVGIDDGVNKARLAWAGVLCDDELGSDAYEGGP